MEKNHLLQFTCLSFSAIISEKGFKMSEHEEKIACHVCKNMIPKATAVHAEGEEYVLHFCNIDCLDYWKKEQAEKEKKSPPKK